MGETWLQKENRARRMERNRTGLRSAPFECLIRTVSSESDTMVLEGPFGTRRFSVLHPFLGNSSWVRSMPDSSLTAIVQYRSDTETPEVVGYRSDFSDDRIITYKSKDPEQGAIGSLVAAAASALKGAIGLGGGDADEPPEPAADKYEAYRPLYSGEHDVGSVGMAQAFWGDRPIYDTRAATVKQSMNQDKLEWFAKTATHRRAFHFHSGAAVQDEERSGVVWRPDNGSYFDRRWVKYKGKFAREHSFHMLDGERLPLFWTRQGHVVDEDGEIETCEDTGKALRLKNIYYTVGGRLAAVLGDREEMSVQLDEEGNLVVDLPEGATTGFIMRIPKGTNKQEVGVDYEMTVGENETTEVGGNVTRVVGGNVDESIDGDVIREIGGTLEETIEGDITRTFNGNKTRTVEGEVVEEFKKSWDLTVADTVKWGVGKSLSFDINGAKIDIDGGSVSVSDTSGNKINTGSSGISAQDAAGNKVETTASAVKITAAVNCEVTAAAMVKVSAPQLQLNGATSPATSMQSHLNVIDLITGVPIIPTATVFLDM